jgi:hypothetical protein
VVGYLLFQVGPRDEVSRMSDSRLICNKMNQLQPPMSNLTSIGFVIVPLLLHPIWCSHGPHAKPGVDATVDYCGLAPKSVQPNCMHQSTQIGLASSARMRASPVSQYIPRTHAHRSLMPIAWMCLRAAEMHTGSFSYELNRGNLGLYA